MAQQPPKSQWVPIVPIPDDCPIGPPRSHPHRGEPESRWLYYGLAGEALGWVYQFQDSGGEPVRLTCLWAQDTATGDRKWHWLSFPEPRPLYGLLETCGTRALLDGRAIPLLLLPTEADADAAREQLAQVALDKGADPIPLPCVSWPGGSGTWGKVDWSPLKGWAVVVVPEYTAKRKALSKIEQDAGDPPESKPFLKQDQQPGFRAAAKIAEILIAQGCDTRLVKLPEVGSEREGWGIRDLIADGITGQALWDWIALRLDRPAPSKTGTAKPLPAAVAPLASGAATELSTPQTAGAAPIQTGPDYEWRYRLVGGKDAPEDCRENVLMYLENHPVLKGRVWADEFARKIVMREPMPWANPATFKPREWDQVDDYELGLWLTQNGMPHIRAEGVLAAAIKWIAAKNRYHPLQDYLNGLQWDGRARMDYWLSQYMGVRNTEYSLIAGNMFLIGLVARAFQPGCRMRTMPIFEGRQFRGKSTAISILGGDWFSDTQLDLRNLKEAYQLIQGVWIYEIAELDAFNRSETTTIKAFISSPKDRFRAPYERAPRDYLRETVFVGSTNQDEYFKDTTGNTRYWPLRCDDFDSIHLDLLREDRDQLFAQAVCRYREGARWWPSEDEQNRLFEPEQSFREIMDPWETMAVNYLNSSAVFNQVSTTQMLMECFKVEPSKIDPQRSMATRIGGLMKRLGWKKERPKREYIYLRPGWILNEMKEIVRDPEYRNPDAEVSL